MMRFSCFPRTSILSQRGSINFTHVHEHDGGSSVSSVVVVSTVPDPRSPRYVHYIIRRSKEIIGRLAED